MTSTLSLPSLRNSDVAQYLSTSSSLTDALAGKGPRTVVLLRAVPGWDGPVELTIGGRRVRLAVAPSVLGVHELVLEHMDTDTEPPVMVVLTDREHDELDPAILARTHRQRVNLVDRWEMVRTAFGATDVDEWLKREMWAAEALLDAAGLDGWPRIPGMLSRGEALSALATRRLRLPRTDTDRIDPNILLQWSHTAGSAERLLGLRDAERDGLTAFLTDTEQAGEAGAVILDLMRAGNGADALAFGLVCAALWLHPQPDNATYQARGRAERRLGDRPPVSADELDRRMVVFARVCTAYFDTQLTRAHDRRAYRVNAPWSDTGAEIDTPWTSSVRAAREIVDPALKRAAELVRELGADTAAAASPILRAGLEARFTAVGNALVSKDPQAVTAALAELTDHRLADDPELEVRIRRVEMAQRLSRWLTPEPDPAVDTVAAALDRHMRETAWVDRALDYLEAGGDSDPALKVPYRALIKRVRDRRREIDREFATALAVWTSAGSDPGEMLTVETFLTRVVAPVAAQRRVMLIVVDGMSAAIATELADELHRGWDEYDPYPVGDIPRRRAMAAALPSLTAVSRTSLFAGVLTHGDQSVERKLFPQHRFRGKQQARIFHKDDLRAEDGHPFGKDLTHALAEPGTHIAVVLNTIDDRLAKERKLGDPSWELREIGDLTALLRTADEHNMAVIITSDHGHVIDRHSKHVDVPRAQSARHRWPDGSGRLAEAEIELSGPRVVWTRPGETEAHPGASIVALWDNDSRYSTQKAGYHGGAALAEITIPILALVPVGIEPPKAWLRRGLNDQSPYWWWPDRPTPEVAREPERTTTPQRKTERAAQQYPHGVEPMFELPEVSPAEPVASRDDTSREDLVSRLLASETFAGQRTLLSRPPQPQMLEKAIRALLEGPLPITALAQRVGYPSTRPPASFAAVLSQLLNYDGITVLETLPDGRTLKLNEARLRTQFGL
ncbi:BREX-2 system phosphatase PglZ [Nocardia sp. NPDC049737]|uniref:BREX-2 system phosphatase PglZ n=1 Tax=Nocardia sp. NPDC049737 TaxID=3154358 RepID=UPI003420338C